MSIRIGPRRCAARGSSENPASSAASSDVKRVPRLLRRRKPCGRTVEVPQPALPDRKAVRRTGIEPGRVGVRVRKYGIVAITPAQVGGDEQFDPEAIEVIAKCFRCAQAETRPLRTPLDVVGVAVIVEQDVRYPIVESDFVGKLIVDADADKSAACVAWAGSSVANRRVVDTYPAAGLKVQHEIGDPHPRSPIGVDEPSERFAGQEHSVRIAE